MANGDVCKTGTSAADPDAEIPSRIRELISWAKSHGAYLNDDVEVYSSPDYGISLRFKKTISPTAQSPRCGNGHSKTEELAEAPPGTRKLPARSRIVSCPFDISLSYLNALDDFHGLWAHSTPLPAEFIATMEPKVIGCFFLIQQFLTSDTSYWGPYIRSLPQPYEREKLATPLYYSESDLKWLQGTNLQAAVAERQEMWRKEFEAGREVLERSPEMEGLRGRWTWELYKWASTIFSSRSFISALIPPEVYGDLLDQPAGRFRSWREKIKAEGPYPVLFPLLDIANHDPNARVEWFVEAQKPPRSFNLITDDEIAEGAQIFNNYAPKGNSELLMGYGFLVTGKDDFRIELKCPSEERRELRKAQNCYRESEETNGRLIYLIKSVPYSPTPEVGKIEFPFFEHGLIDTLAVLVANEREAKFMLNNPQYCPEKNLEKSLHTFMGRNTLCLMSFLSQRVQFALRGMLETHLGEPQTPFQFTAQNYRNGQIATLLGAENRLRAHLKDAEIPTDPDTYKDDDWPKGCILDICSAFTYLQSNHFPVWRAAADAMESVIGLDLGKAQDPRTIEEKDKNLPVSDVNFRAVIPEWDFVLLSLWVFCVLVIYYSEENDLSDGIDLWIEDMLKVYHITSDVFDFYSDDGDKIARSMELLGSVPSFAATRGCPFELRREVQDRILNIGAGFNEAGTQDACFQMLVHLAAKIVAGEMFEVQMVVRGRPKDPRIMWDREEDGGVLLQKAVFLRRREGE